jgi:hypothetical protein
MVAGESVSMAFPDWGEDGAGPGAGLVLLALAAVLVVVGIFVPQYGILMVGLGAVALITAIVVYRARTR